MTAVLRTFLSRLGGLLRRPLLARAMGLAFAGMLPVYGGAPWIELRTPHFTVYCDDGEAQARRALEGFESIRGVFKLVFPGIQVDSPKPMIVIVTRDEDGMKAFLPAKFSGKDPFRPAGYYFPQEDRDYALIRLDVPHQDDQPYFVVFHEYAHSIIHRNFSTLPTWLDEGLADYFGATELHGKKLYLGRVPMARLATLRQEVRLPLEAVLTATQDSPYYQEGTQAGPFYAESWALVHYLYMDPKARAAGLFRAYLGAISKPEPLLQQAQEGFGDLGALNSDLYRYIHQPSYAYKILDFVEEPTDVSSQPRKLDAVEALLLKAEFLSYTGQEPVAAPVFAQVQPLAAHRPEVAAALGLRSLRQGDPVHAKAALEQALALGSQDFRVPYHLAVIAQEGPHWGEPAEAAQILSWLEAAKTLNPTFSGTWMALCRQYSRAPRDPDKALQAGRKALDLEPRNLAHWANFGVACMNLGHPQEAQDVAVHLDQMAASSQERAFAASYRSQLERYQQMVASRSASAPTQDLEPLPAPGQAANAREEGVARPGLHFRLPASLNDLGQEVINLVGQGETKTAIKKVEAARKAAKSDYERQCLTTLLGQLTAIDREDVPHPPTH